MMSSTHDLDGSWPAERWREGLARPGTWDEVLQEVQGGKTLGKIAQERGWPRLKFRNHVLLDAELRLQYFAAREMAGDDMAIEGKETIDNATIEGLAVAKAQSDYRKWLASKWDRGTYGDSVRVEQALEVTLKLSFGKPSELPVVSEQ